MWGYRYVFRFNIDREDINKIVSSRPFKQVGNIKYNENNNGILYWNWIPTHNGGGIIVYHPKSNHRKPKWFQLDLWKDKDIEPYALVITQEHDKENSQILLYNEKEGEAYFILDDR